MNYVNVFFLIPFIVLFCTYERYAKDKKQDNTLVFILLSIDTLDSHRTIQ